MTLARGSAGHSRWPVRIGRRRRPHTGSSTTRLNDGVILAGHVAATAARFAAVPGTVLVLHDTTEFSFTRNTPDGVGHLSYVKGRHRTHAACGLLMHSGLALTTEGARLGLAAIQFWSRKGFKGTNAAQAGDQPDNRPYRGEGKLPLADQRDSFHA